MYRLTYKNNFHRGVTYKEGLNEDPLPFDASGVCRSGGLYFFIGEQLIKWENFTKDCYWIWDVTLVPEPNGSQVQHLKGKSKTDKFILSNKRRFIGNQTVCEILGITKRMFYIKKHGCSIQFVKNPQPSPEERLEAISENGYAIQYIKNPTPKERLASVNQKGYAIQFIKDPPPTPEERLAAVTKNGFAIQFIKDPLPKERLTAVKQNPRVIEMFEEPCLSSTHEERMAVINQSGHNIRFIKNPPPTPKERMAAIKQNGYSIQYIDNPTPEEIRESEQNKKIHKDFMYIFYDS